MTQTELSDRTGDSKSIISSYEAGNIYPSYNVIIKISRIFRVSTDYLLGIKKRVIDVSDLSSNEIDILDKLMDVLEKIICFIISLHVILKSCKFYHLTIDISVCG